MSKHVSNEYIVRCLAYSGAAVRGLAYAGFNKAIEASGLREKIEYVTGSSAGSILAAMTAVGATPEYLESMALNEDGTGLDLAKVMFDGNEKLNLLSRIFICFKNLIYFGAFSSGTYFRNLIDNQIAIVCPQHKIKTFKDLHDCRELELKNTGTTRLLKLYIPVSNLSTGHKEVFSYETTPHLSIADAVRMSSSFPGILTPVKYNGSVYGDAGALMNIPTNLFDFARFYDAEFDKFDHPDKYKPVYNDRTLSCCFASTKEISSLTSGVTPIATQNINNHYTLMKSWINTIRNANTSHLPREVGRTVLIDNLGVFQLNVYIDIDTKRKLIKSAEDATMKFITGKQFSISGQSANLYEFKDKTYESKVHLEGITSLRPLPRRISFAEQYEAEIENRNSCIIM